MSGVLLPAMVAASGGSAMLSGIWLHEHRQLEAMRAGRERLSLRFPLGLEPAYALAALDGLSGLPYTSELVVEVVASEGSIAHFLWVPAALKAAARSTLTGVIPSVRVSEAPASPGKPATVSLRLFVPTPSILSSDNPVAASRSLLAGLASLREGEQVMVRWVLRPGGPRALPQTAQPDEKAQRLRRAWTTKTAVSGFSAGGLVLIRASKARASELAAHIESLLRSRSQIGGVRLTRERGTRTLASLPRTTRSSGWLSTPELLALIGWPVGPDATPGVEVGSREILVPRSVPREGRQLFMGRDASGERPVALSPEAARHHLAVVGPSGVGKSVVLARSILSDIAAGYGGVAIDPKGDLVESVLQRLPAWDADRVVVLDPGDDSRPVPAVELTRGGDPDARADVLVGVLKAIVPDWGIRSETYGRLAIRTLSELPGATLLDIGRLFTDEPFRRSAIARLGDRFLVSSWQEYEALSAAAQADVVQAPMARVTALLSRPRVRGVLASPNPKLDIAELLGERKFLLVSLAPGVLGEAGATLIGAAVMYAVWSAIEGRVVLPPEKRCLINIYVDELATLTNGTPFGIELLAERARGLGASLTVALQTLGRIPEPTRSALLGNLATLISFRAGAIEAPMLARELPGISAQDLMALNRFEVAARVGTGAGSAVAVMTGRTEPLPPPSGRGWAVRDRSAAIYGSPPAEATPPAAAGEPSDLRPGRSRRAS